jgi:undecaprenyl diphosphate synthase
MAFVKPKTTSSCRFERDEPRGTHAHGVRKMTAKHAHLDLAPAAVPQHVVIVMDGNGRWAEQRRKPRIFGHRAGVKAVRASVEAAALAGVHALTLFAFSSENWQRPVDEVNGLMDLFLRAMRSEAKNLHRDGVKLRFIGDLTRFSAPLQQEMQALTALTQDNARLVLSVAVNYGGRWDLAQATRALARSVQAGLLAPEQISETHLDQLTALGDLPKPDLFIRTGGERRISNFLLWQLAYTELYFSDVLWPDFDAAQFRLALEDFASRQRRFGKTGQQIQQAKAGP